MAKKRVHLRITDVASDTEQLSHVEIEDLMPLPNPSWEEKPWTPITKDTKEKFACDLDDTTILPLPRPKNKKEEDELRSERNKLSVLINEKKKRGEKADSEIAQQVNATYAVVRETEKPKWLPSEIVKMMREEGCPRFGNRFGIVPAQKILQGQTDRDKLGSDLL